ncbi:MAG: M20/M25/M40 family metallo-hydrolase [Anaerolineales bacterium]
MSYSAKQFAEKYKLALETAQIENLQGGTCGYELEWNLLDSQLRPLLTVGSGPDRQSFVDYMRSCCVHPGLFGHSQLEIFHWMIEWVTRPYYTPRGAVYESRLLEAALLNTLHQAGHKFGEQLYTWHGNLLYLTKANHESIPGSWHLAKRRYLERCVDLYGDTLATAGIHTNLSLPEPMLAWDFMHLSPSDRGDSHLDDFKNQVYITSTRLMRAFSALFIATTASTPLQAQIREGNPVVLLTPNNSVRNLTFPNPTTLDVPDLYRSHEDYLNISSDLVRRGVRFGNNNWTPVRARSFAEPVEQVIQVTSEQLHNLYTRGLYAIGDAEPVEEMARQIEVENLLARLNIPMARVEVRSDDGGNPLDVDIANLTLKQLLLMRFYADPEFARSFRYDREDINRARQNEEQAARRGLHAEINNPLTGKPVDMRAFLNWTLEEIRPLAEAMEWWQDLNPLMDMAAGGENTSEQIRRRLCNDLGECDEIPLDLLQQLAVEHETKVAQDMETIVSHLGLLGDETAKFSELLQHARDQVRNDPQAPIHFRTHQKSAIDISYPDKSTEIVDLAQRLIRIPSVTVGNQVRLDEVYRAGTMICDYLLDYGLDVRFFNKQAYPAVLAGFPQESDETSTNPLVLLCGHFDVVEPEPNDTQLIPRVEGDYLWGRGAADMKTVVATYMVWMKDTLRQGPPYPPIQLLLVGNEENGEIEPMGTPHILHDLANEIDYIPQLLIAGERTEENGNSKWGEICIQNRGLVRFELIIQGKRGHSGSINAQLGLADQLLAAQTFLANTAKKYLTLTRRENWYSQIRFPFIQVGSPGVYNITANRGVLGVEVRPIPQNDISTFIEDIQEYCQTNNIKINKLNQESGVACDSDNPYLIKLIQSFDQVSGKAPKLGQKLPATSARFAPQGQGIVWGQSGLGPHSKDERHYIPSIIPYYQVLQSFGRSLTK